MRIHSLAPVALVFAFLAESNGFLAPTPGRSFGLRVPRDQEVCAPSTFGKLQSGTTSLLATPSTNIEGTIPPRSVRTGTVGTLPVQDPSNAVKITESEKELTYVEDIFHIDTGPISGRETVKAWVLENEYIAVKGVLLGGNLMGFVDKETDKEYLWLNTDGATSYGADSNAFPLKRGLILHGGMRMAAVSAEHGLYFDTEWDLDFDVDPSGDSASLIFKIKDDQQARTDLDDPMSTGGFSNWGSDPMSAYPVTNADFIFKVTLKKGERFLRTECTVDNTSGGTIQAEAWLPQTWPVTADSQIISHQQKRRIKGDAAAYVGDQWVMDVMINPYFDSSDMKDDPASNLDQYDGTSPYTTDMKSGAKSGNLVPFPPPPRDPSSGLECNLDYPLQWPTADGGILYDFPFMDGNYHAISFGEDDGRGMAYVAPASTEQSPHFTKMWSWGNPDMYNRDEAQGKDPPLAAGRPYSEYYEPWASAFNSAFFELFQFPPGQSSWEGRFVPIAAGLDKDKTQDELRVVVDAAVQDALDSL